MKRQLPQWMLGGVVPSNHQRSTTGDSSRTTSCDDKHIEDQSVEKEPKEPKKRRQSKSRNSPDKDVDDENVETGPKEPKKRRQSSRNNLDKDVDDENVEKEPKKKRRQSSRDNSLDNDIDCGIKESKQRKGSSKNESDLEKAIESEPVVDSLKGKPPRHYPLVKCKERKRTKEENVSSYDETSKNNKNSRKVVDVASTEDEDDIDLTMEDLMIIAKEYIQEDNNSKKAEPSKTLNQSQAITDSRSSRGVPTTTETNHSNVDHPTTTINNGNHKFDTENPTQSMLDVFLGPWLKKTQDEEKKKKSESKTTSDLLDFEFEAYKQRNLLVEEKKPVTTTTFAKKKSSLKDQVMMFLD